MNISKAVVIGALVGSFTLAGVAETTPQPTAKEKPGIGSKTSRKGRTASQARKACPTGSIIPQETDAQGLVKGVSSSPMVVYTTRDFERSGHPDVASFLLSRDSNTHR
jgi:hypothetical protein